MPLPFDLNIRLPDQMNSRLNQIAGQAGQDRSKIARLALLDLLNGNKHFLSQVRKSIAHKAKTGRGLIIQEF